MIPVLYEANEREFETQGLGALSDALSCYVSEELNSTYELEMTYPVNGIHFSDICLGRLILAESAPRKEAEPFSIYKITKPLNGTVIIYAEHISYRLNYIPVAPTSAENCTTALQEIVANSLETNPFSVWTDKTVTAHFETTVPQAFRKCLGGVEGSILDTYRGEYEFNRYTVKLHTNRGYLKETAKIVYGKNLVDLTQEESIDSVVTGIVPFWKGNVDDQEKIVMLPNGVIETEYADSYAYHRTIVCDFSSEFEEEPTAEQLESAANAYIKANLDGKPKVSMKVSFVSLFDSEENKGFAAELLYLGDKVPVYFYKLGIETTGEIVSTKYDTLLQRYDSITIGSVKASLSKTVSEVKNVTNDYVTKDYVNSFVEHQKKLIAGGFGGYKIERFVNGHPSETVYGDTDDINTMVNCIRINKNGIGFSNSGINGPYISALTIDGKINADCILSGTIDGSLIRGSTIKAGALDEEVTSSINNANLAANEASNKADNAQNAASEATNTANSATESANNANVMSKEAYLQAQQAQLASQDAQKLASSAWQDTNDLAQVFVADSTGAKVKEARNSSNYSHMQTSGMRIILNNSTRAVLGIQSHVDDLGVSGYLMFGSHRAEALMDDEEYGTGFFNTGVVQKWQ